MNILNIIAHKVIIIEKKNWMKSTLLFMWWHRLQRLILHLWLSLCIARLSWIWKYWNLSFLLSRTNNIICLSMMILPFWQLEEWQHNDLWINLERNLNAEINLDTAVRMLSNRSVMKNDIPITIIILWKNKNKNKWGSFDDIYTSSIYIMIVDYKDDVNSSCCESSWW